MNNLCPAAAQTCPNPELVCSTKQLDITAQNADSLLFTAVLKIAADHNA
jgi:hypothetical protein